MAQHPTFGWRLESVVSTRRNLSVLGGRMRPIGRARGWAPVTVSVPATWRLPQASGERYDRTSYLGNVPMSESHLGAEGDGRSPLVLPTRLYGRDSAYGRLASAWKKGAEGARVLALVSGYSGVGKIAVVQRLTTDVEASGGLSVAGKRDQVRRSTPERAGTSVELASGGDARGVRRSVSR